MKVITICLVTAAILFAIAAYHSQAGNHKSMWLCAALGGLNALISLYLYLRP